MAYIRREKLSLVSKTSKKATLRVDFTLRLNETEQELQTYMDWACDIVLCAVDEGGQKTPIRYGWFVEVLQTEGQDTDFTFDYTVDRVLLDEDPFWQFWKNTEDEIAARITVKPRFHGVSDSVTDYTDYIRAQFG